MKYISVYCLCPGLLNKSVIISASFAVYRVDMYGDQVNIPREAVIVHLKVPSWHTAVENEQIMKLLLT
jgi:hypothetical protein